MARCGLFFEDVVGQQCCSFESRCLALTADDTRCNCLLSQHPHAPPPAVIAPPASGIDVLLRESVEPPLSPKEIQRLLQKYRGDLFVVLQIENPEWRRAQLQALVHHASRTVSTTTAVKIFISSDFVLDGFISTTGQASTSLVFAFKGSQCFCAKISTTPNFLDHEVRAFQILQREHTPCVVRMIDRFQCSSHDVLVLELGKKNLEELIRSLPGRSCSPDMLLAISICSLVAFRDLHRCNIIHCDFKPNNLVLFSHSPIIKLIDFGEWCEPGQQLKSSNSYCLIQHQVASARTDLVSLAVLIMELGCGVRPGRLDDAVSAAAADDDDSVWARIASTCLNSDTADQAIGALQHLVRSRSRGSIWDEVWQLVA